ncbi:unnamed protein product [Citrullus colocynthis]|uniref:Secreted protein n=1 Tax=Citrullus colocynthis TaxID=252529 RepID=A0ABP0YZQ4_9ROSI
MFSAKFHLLCHCVVAGCNAPPRIRASTLPRIPTNFIIGSERKRPFGQNPCLLFVVSVGRRTLNLRIALHFSIYHLKFSSGVPSDDNSAELD